MDQEMVPLDVICVCSADGEIRPLRLQLQQGEDKLRGDVEEVVSIKKVPYVGVEAYIFVCLVKLGSKRHLMELKYGIRSHSWILRRIVC